MGATGGSKLLGARKGKVRVIGTLHHSFIHQNCCRFSIHRERNGDHCEEVCMIFNVVRSHILLHGTIPIGKLLAIQVLR